MRAERLSTTGEGVLKLATANAADLLDRGTTAEKLAALQTNIGAFDKALGVQGSGLAKQVSDSKSIPVLIREAKSILHDEIDGLVENLQDEYPDFVGQYEAAREIKQSRFTA